MSQSSLKLMERILDEALSYDWFSGPKIFMILCQVQTLDVDLVQ